jgi:4-aminobutyrate aminotransferase-like enzyme
MNHDSSMVNSYRPGSAALTVRQQDLIDRRERVLGSAYRLFYERPIEIVSGQDVWLFGPDGERYLDAYNNVVSVGHCHPRVVQEIARQSAVLSTHTRYLSELVLDYAERLVATMPAALSQVMFTCTGSEANDLALRIARKHTSATGIIITENAYHGVTDAVSQISPSLGPGVNLGSHVRTVPVPDPSMGADAGAVFAKSVAEAIADLQRHGYQPAALIVDTIFSSDGVMPYVGPMLTAAVDLVRSAGGIFIADEVQAGFARTGDTFWGFQRHNLVPDIVTMGKPMGNGYPVAGVVVQSEVVARFGNESRYFNTFGGNSVAMAAAGSVLDVIENQGLQQNAQAVGIAFAEALRQVQSGDSRIDAIRQAGLFIGVDLVHPGNDRNADRIFASHIVNRMRDNGVLISATGRHGNVLKIRPPLTFSLDHVSVFIHALLASLATAQ